MRNTLSDSHISPLTILLTGMMVCAALVFVFSQRAIGVQPTAPEPSKVVDMRALRFEDRPDGTIAIYDNGARQPFEIIASQTNGFLRGTLRGMARARKLNHTGSEPPFELTHWADGRLSLSDPQTGRFVALEPFGPTNTAVFKRLIDRQATPPVPASTASLSQVAP